MADATTEPRVSDVLERLDRDNSALLAFGRDYSDTLLGAAVVIKRQLATIASRATELAAMTRERDLAQHAAEGYDKDAIDMRYQRDCAEDRAATAEAALKAAREALCEAEETLRLVERPAFPDPVHHERVKSLGREIGFGALMSTASAGWREVVEEKGWPGGGEFVAGPCLATVQAALKTIRAALTKES